MVNLELKGNKLTSSTDTHGKACIQGLEKLTPPFFLIFIIILLLYRGYIVTFTKVLTIYLCQIHPLHHSPLLPSAF
jgi:hypothetical protein